MKTFWAFLILFLISLASIAQPPGVKRTPSKPELEEGTDFKIVSDTVYVRYDTVKAKIIVTKDMGTSQENYLTRIYGYVIYKQYIGKIFKEQPIGFYYDRKWKKINPEDVDSISPYNW